MDQLFPFGYPFPTAMYLVLYVVTLVIHVIFMNYVLAGCTYLAFVSVFTGGETSQRQRRPLALLLRDWMPFALGLAITAGVAPLLFVQILYKKHFYTANVLLFHRWMAILPILILGYYLLYVLKSRVITKWSVLSRLAIGGGALLCIAFTGYSWTENHLLSLQPESTWSAFYASGKTMYWHPQLLPRLGVWFFGAFPTMALLSAWQIFWRQRRGVETGAGQIRLISALALGGIVLSVLCGGVYLGMADDVTRAVFTGASCGPYLWMAAGGLLLQAFVWLRQWRLVRLGGGLLLIGSAGLLMALLGMSVVREGIRLAAVDMTPLYDQHAAAAQVGGFSVFLLFFMLNAVAIGYCIHIIKKRVDLG